MRSARMMTHEMYVSVLFDRKTNSKEPRASNIEATCYSSRNDKLVFIYPYFGKRQEILMIWERTIYAKL